MKPPLPIFDSLEYIDKVDLSSSLPDNANVNDCQKALEFLNCYKGSQGTFNAYRREIERLLHWCTLIAKKPLIELKRHDIEEFIHFCQKPPKSWIGINKVTRFIAKEGKRISNPEWRPFVVTVSKAAYQKGERPNPKNFEISQSAVKDSFAILSSFYNYLLQEEYVYMNPVGLIRQKSKFIRKNQSQPKIRRLSERQWQYVIQTAQEHERTLFIMSALYSLYLRISELSANKRWSPTMNHFYRDSEENWWFTTVGKGNKQRQIAVSDSMLEALKRWRKYLGLSALPSPADLSPVLPKAKGQGGIGSTTYIRKIVQSCFDRAVNNLNKDGFIEEAESLIEATVHWLRHTGISDDVKRRPREHVRDDAGHGSGAITDKYIDIELRERHRSAKSKLILSK
ncbi:tyrosine-type recombinase/integrase [Candidatus Paracaedibacter symbiosus]|uniref:tyrosine-type recombinase/integrase n=1 Tax=Candidatus Paracaedibacter symbiosus TaxID=244582 RepID=UPI000509BD5E|nr:site-specific integrase [Candidatus Paracaedibacter symbiosus]